MKRSFFATLMLLTTLATPAFAENLQHTRQLLSTKQCSRCDLSGAGLVTAILPGAQLSGADLSRANLSRADLTGADLRGANLQGASLNGANLTGANLEGADLTGADLRDAYLAGSNLVGVNLRTVYMQGAIGVPQYAGTAEDFYFWAVTEAEKGNYRGAVDFYNQALSLKSDLAPAYLGRGFAMFRLGNDRRAIQDAVFANQLFTLQQNAAGVQVSQQLLEGIKVANTPTPLSSGRTNFANFFGSLGSVLLQLLL